MAFLQKMLIFAQESNTLFIMTTISSEHSNDAIIKSIQAKAESIMPKDAKVILLGLVLVRMPRLIPTGIFLCF